MIFELNNVKQKVGSTFARPSFTWPRLDYGLSQMKSKKFAWLSFEWVRTSVERLMERESNLLYFYFISFYFNESCSTSSVEVGYYLRPNHIKFQCLCVNIVTIHFLICFRYYFLYIQIVLRSLHDSQHGRYKILYTINLILHICFLLI